MTPHAYVAHAVPGRMRIKIPSMRGDSRFFDEAAARLGECPLVESLRTDPRTGSILLSHTGAWRDVAGFGEAERVFELLPNGGLPVVDADGSDPLARLPDAARRYYRPAVAAILLLLALRQVAHGQIFAPATSYVWDALRLLRVLDR